MKFRSPPGQFHHEPPLHATNRLQHSIAVKMKQTVFCQTLYTRSFYAAYYAACAHSRRSAFHAGCRRARSELHRTPVTYRKVCGLVDHEAACRSAYKQACWNPFCHTCFSTWHHYQRRYGLYRRARYSRYS